MVGGGEKPVDILNHGAEQIKAADERFKHFTDHEQEADCAAQASFKTYRDALAELVDFLNAGNIKAYLDQPTQSMQDKCLADRQAYVQYASNAGHAALQSIDSHYSLFRLVATGIAVLLYIVALLMYLAVRRRIVRPLEEACHQFERIATYGSNEIAAGNADLSARAGEQGKGLAVVAGEVRALAQRSAQPAKEIATLIGPRPTRSTAASRWSAMPVLLLRKDGAKKQKILI